ADHPAELAAASRGQHRRIPVPGACVSVGRALIEVTAEAVADSPRVSTVAMKILSITAGAAGMYCGSCLRDNALAIELLARGHDVTLLPLYTPTLTDERNVSESQVLFGGISVYLKQRFPLLRRMPRVIDRLLDTPRVISRFADRSVSTDPKLLGGLTISM